MSYRNPKIYAPDPTAFTRGFSQSFQSGVEMFAQQKAEQDKLRKESEQAEAYLLNQTDLGGYQDLDKRIYDRFQQNIRGVVDSGTFAKMSPAEKQKALFEIRDLKQGFDKFKEILAMPEGELDIRNSDLIELKTAIAKNPNALNISGEGANMSLDFKDSTGKQRSISINGLNSTRVINKQEFEGMLNKFDEDMFKQANGFLLAGAQKGKYEQAEALAMNDYATALQGQLEEEDYSYIYANKIGGNYDGSQEQKQQVLDYKINEFKQRVDSRKQYADIFAPKQEEKPKEKQLGLDDQQREVALSNIISLTDSQRDPETGAITKTSPYFDIRMKGPNDVVPAKYRFRKLDGKYYVIKPGMGTPEEISKEEVYELFGYGEQYKEQQQKIVESNITKAKEGVAARYGIQPVVFDGSN